MALAPVIALLGRLISLFAGTMLAPALCALAYGEFGAAGEKRSVDIAWSRETRRRADRRHRKGVVAETGEGYARERLEADRVAA